MENHHGLSEGFLMAKQEVTFFISIQTQERGVPNSSLRRYIIKFGQRWLISIATEQTLSQMLGKAFPSWHRCSICILSLRKSVDGQLHGQCIRHKEAVCWITILVKNAFGQCHLWARSLLRTITPWCGGENGFLSGMGFQWVTESEWIFKLQVV